jgi:hypothetical protein
MRESNRILAQIQIVQPAVAVADDDDMVVQHDPERCGRFLVSWVTVTALCLRIMPATNR